MGHIHLDLVFNVLFCSVNLFIFLYVNTVPFALALKQFLKQDRVCPPDLLLSVNGVRSFWVLCISLYILEGAI